MCVHCVGNNGMIGQSVDMLSMATKGRLVWDDGSSSYVQHEDVMKY